MDSNTGHAISLSITDSNIDIDVSSVDFSFTTQGMASLIPGHEICGHHVFFYDTKVECVYCEETEHIPQVILDSEPFHQVVYQLYAARKLGEKDCETNAAKNRLRDADYSKFSNVNQNSFTDSP
jgi:hypothetical protein